MISSHLRKVYRKNPLNCSHPSTYLRKNPRPFPTARPVVVLPTAPRRRSSSPPLPLPPRHREYLVTGGGRVAAGGVPCHRRRPRWHGSEEFVPPSSPLRASSDSWRFWLVAKPTHLIHATIVFMTACFQ